MKITRQQRRAAERRAKKPEPGEVVRTSIRHMGRRTKGRPYSRMTLQDIIPSDIKTGRAAQFVLEHPTRRSWTVKKATRELIDLFMPNLPENMVQGMLGRF